MHLHGRRREKISMLEGGAPNRRIEGERVQHAKMLPLSRILSKRGGTLLARVVSKKLSQVRGGKEVHLFYTLKGISL